MERALRDASLRTEERLRVACAVARNGSSALPEDRVSFLTRWACEEICRTYSKKNRSPPAADVCSQLWLFLATMMESRQLLSQRQEKEEGSAMVPLGSLVSVHLLQAMGEVLGSHGTKEQCVQSVLTCLLCILNNRLTLPPILYKFEVVVSLLLALLASASINVSCREEETLDKSEAALLAEKVLCFLLDHFTYLQGTQGNQKKVFKALCVQLLPPVIRLSQSTLVSSGPLLLKLDTLLCSLFGRDHLLEFSSALSGSVVSADSTTATGRGQGTEMSYTKLLFSTLRDLLYSDVTSDRDRDAVLNAVPTLFQGFLRQNRELKKLSRAIEFNLFLKLLWVIGFPLPATKTSGGKSKRTRGSQRKRVKIDSTKREEEESGEGCEDGETWGGEEGVEGEDKDVEEEEEAGEKNNEEIDWEQLLVRIETETCEPEDAAIKEPVLKVLKSCLHLLRVHSVYQVMEDQSRGSRQFKYLSFLCTEVVNNINLSNMVVSAECLCEALQVNHKLVEPLLTGLLLLTTSTSNSKKSWDPFVKQCITVYSKLHQLGVLIGCLFSALDKLASSPCLPTSLSPAFSKPAEDWFCRLVQEMPAGQCVALLEQVTNSIQSVFLAKLGPRANDSSEVVGEGRPRNRRKRRSHENGTVVATSGEGFVSSSFASALLRGVDVLSLVLINSPLSVWTGGGLHREKAREALLAIQGDVHRPLMVAAEERPDLETATLHLYHGLHTLLFCLREIFSTEPPLSRSSLVDAADSSHQATGCTSLWSGDEIKKFVWSRCHGEGSERVPELRMTGNGTENGGFAARYILRALSVQQLRFVKDSLSPEVSALHMNDIFGAVECTLDPTSSWSGQQLDVDERNFPIAVWDLTLSNLSQLHGSLLLPTHLSNIASFLHSALGSAERDREGESEGEGLTARKVACQFLRSESFQEMRELQEAVLGVCFKQTATCLPKSLKDLKPSLLSSGSQLWDSSEHLGKAIELGLHEVVVGEDKPAKRRKSVSKSPQNISVCLEVMRAVPMAYSHPELLHRCVLVLTILHVSMVESLCYREVLCESMEERREQLCELELVLAWVLNSLANCDRVGKKRTRRLSPLPFSDLLSWSYTASKRCMELVEDETREFKKASLLLMEAVMENALKTGTYPESFVHTVVEDQVVALTGSGHTYKEDVTALDAVGVLPESLPESVLHLMVAKLCKVYTSKDSFLHQPVEQLLRKTRECVSKLKKKSALFHPQLVSAFSLLLRTSPPSIDSDLLFKSVTTASWLSEMFCSEQSLQGAVTDLSRLYPVLDVLSISTRITEDDAKTVCLSLTSSWSMSLKILNLFLERELRISSGNSNDYYYLLEVFRGAAKSSESSNSGSKLPLALHQLSELMNRLLSAANRDQAKSWFELLHKESCEDVGAAVAVCHCWSLVLGARLETESQRELRKWHTKILLQCGSLAVQHRGVALITILSLSITIRLVALPVKVGLDSRLVIISLHQSAAIGYIQEYNSQRCAMKVLQSVGQLLLKVLKHHSSVAASCPGLIVTTTNKLVKTALEQCAVKGEEEREEVIGAVVANTLSRVLDHLASQQEFNKYIPVILGCCISAMARNLPAKPVKASLLPGVYALMRRCSDEGTASVQASLDANTRTHFQSLVEDFRKQKRFL